MFARLQQAHAAQPYCQSDPDTGLHPIHHTRHLTVPGRSTSRNDRLLAMEQVGTQQSVNTD